MKPSETNGGHNAGIVSPPSHPRRHNQIATHNATHKENENYVDPDAWQRSAVHHEGSWWPGWQDWLAKYSPGQASPPAMGASQKGYAVLDDAPGNYVLEP